MGEERLTGLALLVINCGIEMNVLVIIDGFGYKKKKISLALKIIIHFNYFIFLFNSKNELILY